MEVDRFKQLVTRLERESAVAPGLYRIKVAALTLLGFGILALLVGMVGFGLFVLIGLAIVLAFSGGGALLLLFKLGKLLLFLAIPLWFLVKSAVQALFIRLPAPQGREVSRDEAPALFAAVDDMRRRMKGPAFHHVLIVDGVNAALVQRPAFGLIGWPRNYLLLGLPLLECLPPAEALAVIAHEYGHLAGSHGHFSAFIYRLRHTWGTVLAYTDHIQGWLGRLVAPLVRWYAPYFNAYTFVLARADEYQADAAAAELVGPRHAAQALKRVNVAAPWHQRFMEQTLARTDDEPTPPHDLMQRWATRAGESPPEADARRWLGDALDREGHFTDSHPTLRARLGAMALDDTELLAPPPPTAGASAAQAWLGTTVERIRAEFDARWAAEVAQPWAERYAEVKTQRARLEALRAQDRRDPDEQIEMLRLGMRLQPATDSREALAAFNAEHPEHPLGLYLEGQARLDQGDRDGIALLERSMKLDPEATRPACERAHAFLVEAKDKVAAEAFAARWRARHDMEALRAQQLAVLDPKHALAPHRLDEDTVSAIKSLLTGSVMDSVDEIHLARRIIPADPDVVQHVLGVKLSWWGRRRGRQQEVVRRLAAIEFPVALVFFTIDGAFAPLEAKFRDMPDARLV